jgi:hypothetical protein
MCHFIACDNKMMSAPNPLRHSEGVGGIGAKEEDAVAAFKKQQEIRQPETGEMTGSQAGMRTKPDCGEESYVGSGKLKDKVILITGEDGAQTLAHDPLVTATQ